MGILTDENGVLKMELISKIDEAFGRKLSEGEDITKDDLNTLAKKAHHFFSMEITEYLKLVDSLESLDQSSWGLPTGHAGLNDFFLSVCAMATDEARIKDEIIKALKFTQ